MAADDLQKSKWRGRMARYAPLILWIALIFFLSSSLGAASNTSRFIRPLLIWLFPTAPEETIILYHTYVRKFGHFSGYAILAFWAWRAFRASAKEFLRKFWQVSAFVTVVLVASIDELIQSLDPTRTGSAYDVLLDISGGLAMILFLWLFIKSKQPA